MFSRGVPTTELPPGYQLDLDRLPISGGGCSGSLLLIVILIVAFAGTIGLVLWGFSATTGSPPEPTIAPSPTSPLEAIVWSTPEPTPTLDSWSLTGTAIALSTETATYTLTPTQDYCNFLTATATFTPTLMYTPDSWQLRGTEVWLEEHPPTATPEPQPTTPKSWCDLYLTPSPTRTPIVGTQVVTSTPTPTQRFAQLVNPSQPVYVYPTAAPQVDAAPIDQQPPQLPPPTAFPTATKTRKPTKTPTIESTREPTLIPTVTESPTATETATPTFAPSATVPPPPSPVPPPVVVVSADCEDGYPEFEMYSLAGAIAVAYRLDFGRLVIDAGTLLIDVQPQHFAFLNAAGPGRYRLFLNGVKVGAVDCIRGPLVPLPVTPPGEWNE